MTKEEFDKFNWLRIARETVGTDIRSVRAEVDEGDRRARFYVHAHPRLGRAIRHIHDAFARHLAAVVETMVCEDLGPCDYCPRAVEVATLAHPFAAIGIGHGSMDATLMGAPAHRIASLEAELAHANAHAHALIDAGNDRNRNLRAEIVRLGEKAESLKGSLASATKVWSESAANRFACDWARERDRANHLEGVCGRLEVENKELRGMVGGQRLELERMRRKVSK